MRGSSTACSAIPGVLGVAQAFTTPVGGNFWNNRVVIGGAIQKDYANFNRVPSADSLVSTEAAKARPSPTAVHTSSPRRQARASSQKNTAPSGISSASGFTPAWIHVNTGC